MHSWLGYRQGRAGLPPPGLSPKAAKESHDPAGIRTGMGMGTGCGLWGRNGGRAGQKAPPSWLYLGLWKLASSQISHSQIPMSSLQIDGPHCGGDGLASVVTVT